VVPRWEVDFQSRYMGLAKKGPADWRWVLTIKHAGGRPADLVQKWTTLDQLPKQRKLATRAVRQTLDQLARTLSHFAILIENSKEFAGGHRTILLFVVRFPAFPLLWVQKSSLSWRLPSGHSQKGLKHAYSY